LPTVDIAILNKERQVLLGRKRDETKFRFLGGHVNAGETLEHAAIREGSEESSLSITSVAYAGSCVIDDWRHRSERTKITSAFFITDSFIGEPNPGDDVYELKWFDISSDLKDQVVDEHQTLIKLLTFKLTVKKGK
jgi:ADP-ribose pyrophosphatase YjhB (NUDIX family)